LAGITYDMFREWLRTAKFKSSEIDKKTTDDKKNDKNARHARKNKKSARRA